MKLKCETILDIYTHKNTKILCQIKVHPSKDNKQQNREWENTCRSITQEQWDSFDKELKNIFEVIRGKREVACNEEIISTFGIKPNIEVKVKKSKLSSTNFYNFLGADDDCVSVGGKAEDSTDNIKNFKQIVYVLEFIWNVKPQPPSITSVIATQKYQPKKRSISTDNTFNKPLSYASYTSSEKKHRVKSLEEETQKYAPNPETSPDNIRNRPLSYKPYTPFLKNYQTNSLEKDTQEYEPNPKTSPDNTCKSPLSYEPYTPSKKKYRANSLDGIKTPGVDFLQHEQFEDEYLPKPINNTTTTIKIPPYQPAPIKETRSSKDSQSSNQSSNKEEVIDETDEELLSQSKGKTIRSKLFKKKSKHGLPKSQEIIETTSLPTTPIEDKTAIKKDSQDDDKSSKLKDVPTTTQLPKPSKKENYKSSQNEVKEKCSSKESNRDKVRKILERKESNSSTDDDFDKPRIINDNNKGLKSAPGANTENKESDVTPPKHKTTKHKHKSSHDDMAQLRRSGRSPVKPKRLIEENVSKDKHKKKIKTQKCSPSNKELFGTDDDDDDGDDKGDDNNNDDTKQKPSILQTPKCENRKKSPSSSSSSSTKKKRKRDKSSECEQEKRDIKTWLCKKKSSSNSDTATTSKENSKSSKKGTSSKDTKKSHSKSRSKSKSPQPAEFVMPSKEEMENIRIKTKLQQEQNEMLKAELDKISVPPPREVETLSLKDMTVEDLLDTFSDHKIILDEIYKNNYKKDHIKGHDGINHCFVIRLMEQNTQLKMLQKLTDVYSNSKSTTQATLYANAMLPEWIVRIYMEKYNFNRVEAIQQIKAQDEYQLHIDEQSDNSFAFD